MEIAEFTLQLEERIIALSVDGSWACVLAGDELTAVDLERPFDEARPCTPADEHPLLVTGGGHALLGGGDMVCAGYALPQLAPWRRDPEPACPVHMTFAADTFYLALEWGSVLAWHPKRGEVNSWSIPATRIAVQGDTVFAGRPKSIVPWSVGRTAKKTKALRTGAYRSFTCSENALFVVHEGTVQLWEGEPLEKTRTFTAPPETKGAVLDGTHLWVWSPREAWQVDTLTGNKLATIGGERINAVAPVADAVVVADGLCLRSVATPRS